MQNVQYIEDLDLRPQNTKPLGREVERTWERGYFAWRTTSLLLILLFLSILVSFRSFSF